MIGKLTTALALAAFLGLAGSATAGDAPDAKALAKDAGLKVFKAEKCNKCHTIKALKIDIIRKEGEEKKKAKAPDLSGVGNKGYESAWIKKFITKEVNRVDEDDKEHKHKKKVKIDDEKDWKALLGFLQKLTFETKKKK